MNNEDVFTLEPFTKDQPRFYILEAGGKRFQFDVHGLMEYMVSSGDFSNPYTRNPLTPWTLERLKQAFLKHCPLNTFTLTPSTDMIRFSQEIHQQREHSRQQLASVRVVMEDVADNVRTIVNQCPLLNAHDTLHYINTIMLPSICSVYNESVILSPNETQSFLEDIIHCCVDVPDTHRYLFNYFTDTLRFMIHLMLHGDIVTAPQ